MARILVVDDQEMTRDSLVAILGRDGHEVVVCSDASTAIQKISDGRRVDLMISDLRMPNVGGMELLAEARRQRPEMPVVLMTAFATVQTAVEAVKLGAYDYIQKPFEADEIKLLVSRTLDHMRLKLENAALRTIADVSSPRALVGSSSAMEEVKKQIDLLAQSDATVLILSLIHI